VLVKAGFTPVGAMRAITTLGAYVTGFVLEEQGRSARPPSQGPPADAATRTPTLMAAVAQGGVPDGPAAFDDGLALLLDGIAASQRAS